MNRGVIGRWTGLLLVVWTLLGSTVAQAHGFNPVLLHVDEVAVGRYEVSLQMSAQTRALVGEVQLQPRWPEHCRVVNEEPQVATTTIDCGARGLEGGITLRGLERLPLDVVAEVRLLDGSTRFASLAPGAERLRIHEGGWSLHQRNDSGFLGYLRLGVAHIFGGMDHLLFVVGLVLLVGAWRKLLVTITAFTMAHSLTLAASVLGWLRVPQAPVEAVIAISIVLLALELARPRRSWTRRLPAVVALAFGLVHGLGFAGALARTGLPADALLPALVGFNVGVELGQLAVILAVLMIVRLLGSVVPRDHRQLVLHRLPAYAMGTVATAWALQRVAGFWQVGS